MKPNFIIIISIWTAVIAAIILLLFLTKPLIYQSNYDNIWVESKDEELDIEKLKKVLSKPLSFKKYNPSNLNVTVLSMTTTYIHMKSDTFFNQPIIDDKITNEVITKKKLAEVLPKFSFVRQKNPQFILLECFVEIMNNPTATMDEFKKRTKLLPKEKKYITALTKILKIPSNVNAFDQFVMDLGMINTEIINTKKGKFTWYQVCKMISDDKQKYSKLFKDYKGWNTLMFDNFFKDFVQISDPANSWLNMIRYTSLMNWMKNKTNKKKGAAANYMVNYIKTINKYVNKNELNNYQK